jgi:hypothetical protein
VLVLGPLLRYVDQAAATFREQWGPRYAALDIWNAAGQTAA